MPKIFTESNTSISELLRLNREILNLSALGALAGWDEQCYMPKGASAVRGEQVATLNGLVHEKVVSKEMGRLLDELSGTIAKEGFTDADRGLYRHVRRDYDKSTKLSKALVEEVARAQAAAFSSWIDARAKSDFAIYAPHLQRTLELQREIADRFGWKEDRYDALLDMYEPNLTARHVRELFGPIRKTSTALLKRITASGKNISTEPIARGYTHEKQLELCKRLVVALGYDLERGQISVAAHPFMTSFGAPYDVRLTVRTQKDFLQASMMAAMHECGHALYEQGIAPELVRTPLANGASLGMHESQSRLWENGIGRTMEFWKTKIDLVREIFPEQMKGIELLDFVRALNKVEPSFIRVEADEVTYNLHIMIRFELEHALVNGDLSVESLPNAWNEKYRDYLGITPANDAEGVLQDVHWTGGFGYFPTYTMGNLYGAQIRHKMSETFSDFDARVSSGDTSFILRWLTEHMYKYGATFFPEELIQRMTGEPLNPQYFAEYLQEKFETVYELN